MIGTQKIINSSRANGNLAAAEFTERHEFVSMSFNLALYIRLSLLFATGQTAPQV
jgi:hypothetical protein